MWLLFSLIEGLSVIIINIIFNIRSIFQLCRDVLLCIKLYDLYFYEMHVPRIAQSV
jgi:hypothetical protein